MSQFPPTVPGPIGAMRPHRGTMVLVFGILGLVLCIVFGIMAWVMGNGDLRQMDAGQMDPSGRGMTQAGKVLGIVGVCLQLLAVLIWLVMVVIIGVGAAAAGGMSGGTP